MAVTVNRRIDEGSVWKKRFSWIQTPADLVDLSGWCFEMHIRNEKDDATIYPKPYGVSVASGLVEIDLTDKIDTFVLHIPGDYDSRSGGEFEGMDEQGYYDVEAYPMTGTSVQAGGALSIAVADSGSSTTLTLTGGVWGILADNFIRISSAEDSGNDGYYKVMTATDTVLTVLPQAPSENAADTAMLVESSDLAGAFRLMEGKMEFSKQVTRNF